MCPSPTPADCRRNGELSRRAQPPCPGAGGALLQGRPPSGGVQPRPAEGPLHPARLACSALPERTLFHQHHGESRCPLPHSAHGHSFGSWPPFPTCAVPSVGGCWALCPWPGLQVPSSPWFALYISGPDWVTFPAGALCPCSGEGRGPGQKPRSQALRSASWQ